MIELNLLDHLLFVGHLCLGLVATGPVSLQQLALHLRLQLLLLDFRLGLVELVRAILLELNTGEQKQLDKHRSQQLFQTYPVLHLQGALGNALLVY